MMIDGNDLIEAGYQPGPMFGKMLAKVAELEERGISDKKYVIKLLRREFSAPPPKLKLRDQPAPLAEAIEPCTEEERDNVEAVRRRMHELLLTPVIERGAVMPDACPAGPGRAVIPVGGAIAVENAIIPAAHSADVCCSMFATFFEARSEPAGELDALTRATRFGMGHRHLDDLVEHPVHDEDVWDNPFLKGMRERARAHMADQGDGNHFAYLGEIEVGAAMAASLRLAGHDGLAARLVCAGGPAGGRRLRVLVTHHGSRGLGAHLYKRGQNAALKHVARVAEGIPNAAAWLDAKSPEGEAYWEALGYVGRWTRANHESIHRRFLERIGADEVAAFGNEHNFVWRRGEMFFHGKGATPAWRDEAGRPLLGLIPLNMAEPILIVLGGDQREFLSFAPHGAGRNISRSALLRSYPDAESRERAIEEQTRGIDVRWFCGKPDLSETPVAYKNAAQVKEQIVRFGLAQVIGEIRPLGCIMAGDAGPAPWRSRREELSPKQLRQMAHRAERRTAKQRRWEEE